MKLVVKEDSTAREYRAACARKKMHAIIPRVAIVGYSLSLIAVLIIDADEEMDRDVFWGALIVPTTFMLLYLYVMPYVLYKIDKRKWKITKKKIVTSDGFRAPVQRITSWSRRPCPDLAGYTQIHIQIQHRFGTSLSIKNGEEVDKVIQRFQELGVPERPEDVIKPTVSAP